jgi:transposase-like protein
MKRLRGGLVPQVCSVCSHEDRKEIDRALVRGESMRGIAARYGTVGRMSLQRHRKQHLPELLAKGYEAERMAEADELLMDVRRLQERTLLMLQEAERAGDLRTALAAVREPRNNLALLAEMRGELDRRPTINLVVAPEWLELRAVIVGALDAHPGARGDVLRALEGATNGRA